MRRPIAILLYSLTIALAVCALDMLPRAVSATAISSVTLGLLVRFSVLATAHHRLRGALDEHATFKFLDGVRVRVVDGPQPAMVVGILRPSVYLHPRTLTLLDPPALSAVVAHECAHARRRDPLRLLLLATVEPLARLIPGARQALRTSRSHVEIAADRGALRNGATRSALARALLVITPLPSHASIAAFASADSVRLESLLHDPDDQPGPQNRRVRRLMIIATTSTFAFALIHGQAAAAITEAMGC